MKTKRLFTAFAIALLIVTSCKKSSQDDPRASTEKLNAAAEGGLQISTAVQSFMLSSLSVAADSGYSTGGVPEIPASMKINSLKSAKQDYGWTGPDGDGWYTRDFSYMYDYYEKVRFRDTIDYVRVISYSGGDGSYKNTTTTRYIKYTKNNKTLYKGYSIWEVEASGYNEISKFQWRIEFTDWNPNSNAGIYDWYWGVSENSGGDAVPYHRFEHLEATETGTEGWLHVRVICYDDHGTETWDFEYDTPWVPVDMPEIPQI